MLVKPNVFDVGFKSVWRTVTGVQSLTYTGGANLCSIGFDQQTFDLLRWEVVHVTFILHLSNYYRILLKPFPADKCKKYKVMTTPKNIIIKGKEVNTTMYLQTFTSL